MNSRAGATTPGDLYARHLGTPGFVDDPLQRAVVARLDDLALRVLRRERRESGWRGRLARAIRPVSAPERGIYLWGGVGRGKTFLMDLFYDALPLDRKVRLHFHRFMQRTHRELARLSGVPNPLTSVADIYASEARILCFDEFFVSDIGDAMILGELLARLFERGVTLFATSNIPPARLYWNGLQRRSFLPAIAALEANTDVLELGGADDYRLRVLERAEIYHVGVGGEADAVLAASFGALAPDARSVASDVDLEIEGRPIRCRRLGDDIAWFDFAAICEGPRSHADYIELAREYHAVLVGGVPVFTAQKEDPARRFISLVDEFYDHNVKLIVSAEAPVESLYRGERLAFEFQRTVSRLLEMQSHEYLGRTHEP
jgi:cell division protein ZapE